jgi:GTP-binding protein YchF
LSLELVDRALVLLREGKPARLVNRAPEERKAFRALNLLTAKPVLYVCNVEEESAATGNSYSRQVEERAKAEGAVAVVISARIESELAQLDPGERQDYMEALGLAEPGLNRLIQAGYALLDLVTFFTAGPNEARAWTVRRGAKAPEAAGTIHSDFERGFIRAETIAYSEFVDVGSLKVAREKGLIRSEGKEYVVQDGDILLFRFNV